VIKAKTTLAVFLAVLASAACAGGSGGTQSPVPRNSEVITSEEVQANPNISDAYALVQRVRPSWISKARVTRASVADTAGVSNPTGSGNGGLLIYLDNTRLGGITALADIPTSVIDYIELMDPATAAALFPGIGPTFVSGAIVVHARKGR